MLPRTLLNEGNQIYNFMGTVSVRTFVIPFYYGSGSGSAKAKATVPSVPIQIPVLQHWLDCVISLDVFSN